jgi:hypothetical protein
MWYAYFTFLGCFAAGIAGTVYLAMNNHWVFASLTLLVTASLSIKTKRP